MAKGCDLKYLEIKLALTKKQLRQGPLCKWGNPYWLEKKQKYDWETIRWMFRVGLSQMERKVCNRNESSGFDKNEIICKFLVTNQWSIGLTIEHDRRIWNVNQKQTELSNTIIIQ